MRLSHFDSRFFCVFESAGLWFSGDSPKELSFGVSKMRKFASAVSTNVKWIW
jgi:hypothetical protein